MSEQDKTINLEGSCLCGKVELKASKIKPNVGACHCGMCRKWVGGPYLAIDCASQLEIVQGKELVTSFESTQWASRAFCKNCGSALYYYLKPANQFIVSAGLFDESSFVLDHQVFIDNKPDYYEFANETHNMTEAEIFAKYMG